MSSDLARRWSDAQHEALTAHAIRLITDPDAPAELVAEARDWLSRPRLDPSRLGAAVRALPPGAVAWLARVLAGERPWERTAAPNTEPRE